MKTVLALSTNLLFLFGPVVVVGKRNTVRGLSEYQAFDNSDELKDAVSEALRHWGEGDADVFKRYGSFPDWDVSLISNIDYLFDQRSSFNGDISSWDVARVTSMTNVFHGAEAFNGDLSGWDVSRVESMYGMFGDATSFNRPLNDWDVSSVNNMGSMFKGASAFGEDASRSLANWDVSRVTTFHSMFSGSAFNGDISSWTPWAVTDVESMFSDADNFNRNLCAWGDFFRSNENGREDGGGELYVGGMFEGSGCEYQDDPVLPPPRETPSSSWCHECAIPST